MKKSALILSLFLCTSIAANAYVDSNYTSSEQYLVNIGYSKEAAKVGTIVNQDPYRENYEDEKTPKWVGQQILRNIFPGAYNDLDFYNHSIEFNNYNWKDY